MHLADVRAIASLADDLTSGSLEVRAEVTFAGVRPEPGWTVEARLADLTGTLAAPVPHTGRFEGPRPSRHRRQLADRAIAGMPLTEEERTDLWPRLYADLAPANVGQVVLRADVAAVRPWSSEVPILYPLTVVLRSPAGAVVEEVVRARRLPTGRDRRAGPAHQRPAGLHPGRQPPRLRPAHRAA